MTTPPTTRRPGRASTRDAGVSATAGEGSELRRLYRALRTLSAGNRTLLRASDERELLQAMCRVIVDEGGYRMSCAGYALDDEGKTLSVEACAFPADADPEAEAVFRSMTFSWADSELGQNPGGIAIRTGRPSISQNILDDPALAPWRAEAVRFGYASASAFPLRIGGKVVGALGLCAAEADAFDAAEVELLGELAEDLTYGIANLRTRVKHQEAEATIQRMAYYDALTGLPNRSLLRGQLQAAIDAAHQQHRPLALLFLSLGHLAQINDTLGYASGDLLQQEVGRRLPAGLKEEEVVARVGDGEFAVLLPQGDADYATHCAQRLGAMLHEPLAIEGLRLDARAAIGIAVCPGHGADPDVLLRRARVAMVEARRGGCGQAIYSAMLDQTYAGRLALMGDLRHAIAHDQLALYCQPEVQVTTSQLCGAEALVRWQHPTLGLVSTGEFVRLAEYSGLIAPLTAWVLDAAFRHRHAWHEAGFERPLSVNLSAHDLRDPGLLARIEGLVATWGAEPDWIQFELTESAFMEDPAGALATLTRLKALGVRLFVDDFGIGHSSLSYLQRLPVDAIKIDQSFVAPILENRGSAAIVRSAVDLGHDLGLEVVAEGVESRDVWDRLAELGCDVVQGYFVGRPMPAERFGEWQKDSPWRDQRPMPPPPPA